MGNCVLEHGPTSISSLNPATTLMPQPTRILLQKYETKIFVSSFRDWVSLWRYRVADLRSVLFHTGYSLILRLIVRTHGFWKKLCYETTCKKECTVYKILYCKGVMSHNNKVFHEFISSLSSAAYMRQWTGLSLVQVIACRLFSAKPLPEPMLVY